jgi:5-formyltetrahydrofolate cyclo-ligase
MESGGLTSRKIQLRRDMVLLRDAIPHTDRVRWSRLACGIAAEWIASSGFSDFMIYAPFRSELDTRPLIEWAWRQEIGVIVPKSNPADRSMELYQVNGWDHFLAGAYGIMEPDPEQTSACGADFAPEAVFVPGLAYDVRGGRLGYGGGYYDRFRESLERNSRRGNPVPPWIGLGYELQLTAEVPMEPHDAAIDGLITERTAYFFDG